MLWWKRRRPKIAPKSMVLRKALMITTIGKKDITADHSGTRRRAHILSGTVPAVAIPYCLHQIPQDSMEQDISKQSEQVAREAVVCNSRSSWPKCIPVKEGTLQRPC